MHKFREGVKIRSGSFSYSPSSEQVFIETRVADRNSVTECHDEIKRQIFRFNIITLYSKVHLYRRLVITYFHDFTFVVFHEKVKKYSRDCEKQEGCKR